MPKRFNFKSPFFAPMWRRILICVVPLVVGLTVFVLGASYVGTAICAVAFWLGYELLVIYDDGT